eukprot:gene8929-12042_t
MYKVVALYKFVNIVDPNLLKEEIVNICQNNNIVGALIIANEGINGTIAGLTEGMNTLLSSFESDERFIGMEIKTSEASIKPFYRMRVLVKPEIVTLGYPQLDCITSRRGTYIEPKDWNDLINQPDVVIIDVRNDYEVQVGSFVGALNPSTNNFKEFPTYVENNLLIPKSTPIAMFCTGGIRCEKASSYMINLGFENVYNLKGGILKYLEDTPEENTKWQGECFVFDQRITVKHGLIEGTYSLCRCCRHPLSLEDIKDTHYEEGISCVYCYNKVGEKKKNAAAERQRQILLSAKRNVEHLGYKHHIPSQRKVNETEESIHESFITKDS